MPASDNKDKLVVNKDLIGQDAAVLAERIGVQGAGSDTELLFGETDEPHIPSSITNR